MSEDLVTVYPLAGWDAKTLPGAHALLHLVLVPNEQALTTGERLSVPVAMTAAQARELAEVLLRTAEAAEMGQAPTATRS